MRPAWRPTLLLLSLAAAAAAVAELPLAPVSATQPAEPGEGEAAALAGLAAIMGAGPEILASWSEKVASEGSLCGWASYPGPSASGKIKCDNTTGAITDMQAECWPLAGRAVESGASACLHRSELVPALRCLSAAGRAVLTPPLALARCPLPAASCGWTIGRARCLTVAGKRSGP